MRLFKLFVPLITVLLVSCGGATTTASEYSVQLNNPDNSSYDNMGYFSANEIVNLPILEKEDQLFVGWSDGEDIYYDELTVTEDVTLTAVFEDLSEVFVYEELPYNGNYTLKGYTGEAKYLKLPEEIDGKTIMSIYPNAFEDSNLIEVYIPRIYGRIGDEAFHNSLDLEKVVFYGEYYGERDLIISVTEYNIILEENPDTCVITEDNTDSWKFSDGCPIKEVTRKNPTIIIQDEEYYTLEVIVDLRYYDEEIDSLQIDYKVFANTPKLHTVEFPERFSSLNPYIFENNPSLTTVRFDNNLYYEVIEDVIYRKEDHGLIYYPSGLEAESFTIPENVTEIYPAAFFDNQNLITLTINENIGIINTGVFYQMHSLEEFIVEENNEYLYTIDGVLYTESHALLAYPVAKAGADYEVLDGTVTIAPGAFWGQKHLENITLPVGLKYIGYNAFNSVEKIKTIDLPSTVILIDAHAFTDSSVDVVIVRRSGVIEESITNSRQVPADGTPTFYVPDDSLDLYKYNQAWAGFMNYIKPMSEYEDE